MGAFLVSINSWTVMMSRGAFEANLVTLFIPLGIYLFLKKKYNLSALVFGLTLFTYHSAKLITPIVVFGLVAIFWRQLQRIDIRKLMFPLLILLLFIAMFAYSQVVGGAGRINERIIFQGALEEGAKAKIELIQKGTNPTFAKLLHNKYQVVAQRFVTNYLQYFSFRFLFTRGAAETTYGMIPGVGVLYIFEGILLLGLIPAVFDKRTRKIVLIFLVWLFVAPIPAALATGVGFSANRAEAMVPVLQILEVFGVYGLGVLLSRFDKKVISLASFVFALFVIFQIQHVFRVYFTSSPLVAAPGMLSGNIEVAAWLYQNSDGKNVIISRKLSEPQIYVAFANKWDPGNYQNATRDWKVETWVDQIPVYSLGKYTFKNIDLKTDIKIPNTLVVGLPEEFLPGQTPVKIFYFPDGRKSIEVLDTSLKQYASTN